MDKKIYNHVLEKNYVPKLWKALINVYNKWKLKSTDLYLPGRLLTSWPLIKSSTSSGFRWYCPSGFAFLVAILARRILEPIKLKKNVQEIFIIIFKFLKKTSTDKLPIQFLSKTMKNKFQFWSLQTQYKTGRILLSMTDYNPHGYWIGYWIFPLFPTECHFNTSYPW